MTAEEIAFAALTLFVIVSFVIAGSVFVALVVTDIIEERRSRRKAVAAAGCAERSRGDQQRSSE